jgi:hypothetical protein
MLWIVALLAAILIAILYALTPRLLLDAKAATDAIGRWSNRKLFVVLAIAFVVLACAASFIGQWQAH